MKKFFQDFKNFIARGNVLDMAVGIIVGGAFTAIITALVNGILTPLLQMAGVGSDGFGALQLVLRQPQIVNDVEIPAVVLDFGIVISAIITFLLTAFVLFLIVRTVNKIHEKAEALKAAEAAKKTAEEEEAKAEEPAPAPAPTEAELLAEIRDLLKAKTEE